jgi:carbonic anhydrase
MSHGEFEESLWPLDLSWNCVALTALGNQVRNRARGETVIDGSLEHLVAEGNVNAVIVVGHTACDVIGDAYERYVVPKTDLPKGIEMRFDPIVSVVEDAFDTGLIDASTPLRTAQYRLVEYNVVRQVEFLTGVLPEAITIAGYVHDQDGAYSSFPGKHHLATVDGETDSGKIQSRVPDNQSIPLTNRL